MSLSTDLRFAIFDFAARIEALEARGAAGNDAADERDRLHKQLAEAQQTLTAVFAERDRLQLKLDALVTSPDDTSLQARIVRLEQEKAEIEKRLLSVLPPSKRGNAGDTNITLDTVRVRK